MTGCSGRAVSAVVRDVFRYLYLRATDAAPPRMALETVRLSMV